MAQNELARLRAENETLRTLLVRIYYMARRYASGRHTGAPSQVNATSRVLLQLGIGRDALEENNGALFAYEHFIERDTPDAQEMGRAYDFDHLDVDGRPDSEQAAFAAGPAWMRSRCAMAAQQQATWVTEDSYVAQVDLRSRIVACIEGQVIEQRDKYGVITTVHQTKQPTIQHTKEIAEDANGNSADG